MYSSNINWGFSCFPVFTCSVMPVLFSSHLLHVADVYFFHRLISCCFFFFFFTEKRLIHKLYVKNKEVFQNFFVFSWMEKLRVKCFKYIKTLGNIEVYVVYYIKFDIIWLMFLCFIFKTLLKSYQELQKLETYHKKCKCI